MSHTPSTYNEKKVLQDVARGDTSAYKMLFLQYWDQIYSTAFMFTKSPELAEDLTQDVFARIWMYRARLAEVKKFESFLFTIARNLAFDRLRKEVYVSQNDDFFETYFRHSVTPVETIELKELKERVEVAIRSLPAQQQEAFRLSRFAGLTHEQIAARMGVSPLTVKSHIVRAIRYLRAKLETNDTPLMLTIWILLFL